MNKYQLLLKAPEWQKKRNKIEVRDHSTCTSCGNEKLYDGASLGVVGLIKETDKWLIINPLTYEKSEFSTVLISKTRFTYIPEHAPILVSPYTDASGKSWMNLVALKGIEEEDDLMLYIWAKYGTKNSAKAKNKEKIAYYNKALKEYKDSIRTKWSYIFGLHVHHKYYQVGKKPWEYPDDALTTLCWQCHTELHQSQTVQVLDENGNLLGLYNNCTRCHGAGWFPEYKHVEGGVCFRCNGAKYEELIVFNED